MAEGGIEDRNEVFDCNSGIIELGLIKVRVRNAN
jgi:hypothetical protein